MNLCKDVLGLIVLKLEFKDVLNLRASCKYYDKCIRSYNKYWFLRWLIRVYRFKKIFKFQLGKHINFDCRIQDFSFELPYIECVYPNYNNLNYEEQSNLVNEVKKHPLYSIWTKEYREFIPKQYEGKNYLDGYCNAKHFQYLFPDYVCKEFYHYSNKIDSKYLFQPYHEIIHERLFEFYETKINYFSQYCNFKPEHVRCNYCKHIYDVLEEFTIDQFICAAIITKEGIDIFPASAYHPDKIVWKNILPTYLEIRENICDDCITILVENKELKILEQSYSESSEDL
jgi:hypothetical protein